MRKELIWNSSLLLFAILLIFFIAAMVDIGSRITGCNGSYLFPFPAGLTRKLTLGTILGMVFICFRYVNLGILSIAHKELRLFVLMCSYSLPLFIVIFAWSYALRELDQEFRERFIPIKELKQEIQMLRKIGFFKNQAKKSDDAVLQLAIGLLVLKSNGYIESGSYWESKTALINHINCMKLDTKKAWGETDLLFYNGGPPYIELVKTLAAISEGNFVPEHISENWHADQSVEILFEIGKEKHSVNPKSDKKWPDEFNLIQYVNKLMRAKDYQFYYAEGEERLVIGLTAAELEKVTKATGVTFLKSNQ